ncbi:MAG: sigma-54-dependent Fis family transcriptional regulator, partial [Desulfobacula sp.]|nr:sigma-54-dependent Fis family transcriptional regulator [Desulfobacula sp.]
ELKNAMEYAFVTTEGLTIQLNHLPQKISTPQKRHSPPAPALAEDDILPNEKSQLIKALKKTNGNQTKAAKILNINRVTVWNRMKKYGIDLKKVLSV